MILFLVGSYDDVSSSGTRSLAPMAYEEWNHGIQSHICYISWNAIWWKKNIKYYINKLYNVGYPIVITFRCQMPTSNIWHWIYSRNSASVVIKKVLSASSRCKLDCVQLKCPFLGLCFSVQSSQSNLKGCLVLQVLSGLQNGIPSEKEKKNYGLNLTSFFTGKNG